MSVTEIFASITAVAGAFFMFVAGLGVLRLRDIYMRMHAATKAGALGLGLLLGAVAVTDPSASTILKCAITIAFIYLTAPIAAHMIGRAAYIHKCEIWSKTRPDELAGKYSKDHNKLDS